MEEGGGRAQPNPIRMLSDPVCENQIELKWTAHVAPRGLMWSTEALNEEPSIPSRHQDDTKTIPSRYSVQDFLEILGICGALAWLMCCERIVFACGREKWMHSPTARLASPSLPPM